MTEPFGHPVSLGFRRRRPDRIAGVAGRAGLAVRARVVREPEEGLAESAPRTYLIVRKPAAAGGS
ncbi:hypothetical protein AB0D83_40045 [Streptomyces decoyicus]|uniref:hypothetical protein n=1 Tax=Streptomyces decoyicus TaxID=249567 RepID=UPI0033ED6780